jgi:IS5 family transposase
MVRRRERQRSLWEVVLPDADKLWPAELRRIDELLDDDEVIEVIARGLETRWPASRRRGREGTSAEVVLRMLVLKHLYDLSYADLERHVRANLVYRAFARIGCERVPDEKTILKIAKALGPEVIATLHRRVVGLAVAAGVATGRRMRIDTTVVETNVHYPTDSSLLIDGVRVLTRTAKRIADAIGTGRHRVRNRQRSVGRRGLEIGRAARSAKTNATLERSYRRLIAATRATLREAATMGRRAAQYVRRADRWTRGALADLRRTLDTTMPLIHRVIDQTRRRVFGGDIHVAGKVVSVFEPHTETIRKGKIAKPTEFGKLITVQEAEQQIVTAYAVHDRRPADVTLWTPALDVHEATFGRVPELAAADRGFTSARNERAAIDRGVRHVVLPACGVRSPSRRAFERQRWFRRGQRWRVGCEGRISVLKRRFGLRRCLYHGQDGVERWVGLGVIASNLVAIAKASP